MERVTGVFDNLNDAEAAVTELRGEGITDKQLSIVTRHPEAEKHGNWKGFAIRGAGVGAGAGAVMGIAAAFIPGLGPFLTAGVLTSWLGTVAGTATSGAVVGGIAGGIASGLEKAGYDKEEAKYYGREVEHGGTLVAVDLEGEVAAEDAVSTLLRHHGRTHEAHVGD